MAELQKLTHLQPGSRIGTIPLVQASLHHLDLEGDHFLAWFA
jgi:hypothetical protein